MSTSQHFPQIRNTRQCINAKPPINHDAKHAQNAIISDDVSAFLARGGVVEVIQDFGRTAKAMTYKQRNDSTYVRGDV
tara:strand:+ start:614 stop:847 length:234 start_codon:yes stop_codon:yes gene_type:complete